MNLLPRRLNATCKFALESLSVVLAVLVLCNVVRAVTYNATLLHPVGFESSYAVGASGTSQVGYGIDGDGAYHALLWNGTAASVVDLNPAGWELSGALGVWGASQVGYGAENFRGGLQNHALLWNGTAASVVDLNPAGFTSSAAHGVWGASQVGSGYSPARGVRALLWNGAAASVVDLNPAGMNEASATGVSGAGQVGYGLASGRYHALVWNGTAASAVDLHPFLTGLGPAFTSSRAKGISDDGTIVGHAHDGTREYAVLWTPVPEPTSLVLAAILFGYFSARRTVRRELPTNPRRRMKTDPITNHQE